MPLCKNPVYIPEPTPLQCGQAVLAMLTGKTAEEIAVLTGTERETTLKAIPRKEGRQWIKATFRIFAF